MHIMHPCRGHVRYLQDACTSRQQSLGAAVAILFSMLLCQPCNNCSPCLHGAGALTSAGCCE